MLELYHTIYHFRVNVVPVGRSHLLEHWKVCTIGIVSSWLICLHKNWWTVTMRNLGAAVDGRIEHWLGLRHMELFHGMIIRTQVT